MAEPGRLEPPRVERLSRGMLEVLVLQGARCGMPMEAALARACAVLRLCQSRN